MAFSATVTIVGLERLLAKLGPQLFMQATTRLVADVAVTAQKYAREGAPKDTGALTRSIMVQASGLQATVGSSLVYASVMEEGRRAGARMPPPKALQGWAARHGGGGRGAAFLIARAIGRRGIRGRFFMRRATEQVQRDFPRLAHQWAQDVAARWGS